MIGGSQRHVEMLAQEARRWLARRTVPAGRTPSLRTLATRKRAEGALVSVVLPALNEEPTIGSICREIRRRLMDDVGLVDELLVIDGGSSDGTAAAACLAGARVLPAAEILPEVSPAPGKGDSLWRSLAATSGDIVVWIDADIRNFDPRFVSRLVAPLLEDPRAAFAKAYYRRPIECAGQLVPEEGGRVTELLARPLLASFFPELGGFIQPLAGEYAGRREALERIPFLTGYSVEVAILIDLLGTVGLDSMRQVDLGERVHRNRPLRELTPMACGIARTVLRRAEEWGRANIAFDYAAAPLLVPTIRGEMSAREVKEIERPPMGLLTSYARARGLTARVTREDWSQGDEPAAATV